MGLGDLIEKITTYTGIKWVVKKIWRSVVRQTKRKANKVKLW